MKVYFIRHGETEANAKKIHQYCHDPLSQDGIKQAEILAKRRGCYKIDIILSSPYERSKQTAEIISQQLNKPIQYDNTLRELKRPSEIEGKSTQDDEVKKIKDIITKNAHDPNFRYSDEESFSDFKQRALTILENLSRRVENDILVITHGQVITMLFCVMVFGDDLKADNYQSLKSVLQLNNSGITVFDYSNNKWSLVT